MERRIDRTYGERHDCEAIGGAWVVTTDPKSQHTGGYIGIRVCHGSCRSNTPRSISALTWYQPAAVGAERLAGLNPDGTIFFEGGAGEIAFDPATGRFTPERQHG